MIGCGKLIAVDVPKMHCLYHVKWAYSKGVVGRCIAIDEEKKSVTLRNPKTKKDWANPVKWSDLLHTRRMEFKIKKRKP